MLESDGHSWHGLELALGHVQLSYSAQESRVREAWHGLELALKDRRFFESFRRAGKYFTEFRV